MLRVLLYTTCCTACCTTDLEEIEASKVWALLDVFTVVNTVVLSAFLFPSPFLFPCLSQFVGLSICLYQRSVTSNQYRRYQ